MTTHHQPPPTDHQATNRAIAQLLGWTYFDKNILGEPNAVDPEGVARSVPDWTTDHGAALKLLETVCTEHDLRADYIARGEECWVVRIAWFEPRRYSVTATADTLPAAIALAALAALTAMQEARETTNVT